MRNLFNYKNYRKMEKEYMNTPSASRATVPASVVHAEFDSAGDRALAEAQAVLSKLEMPLEEKASRLKKLGFSRSSTVQANNALEEQVSVNRRIIDTINYYQQKYPHYKFLFREQVEEICKKYGLIIGPVYLYKGDVPEKNLREIEEFKVSEEDTYYVNKELDKYFIHSAGMEEILAGDRIHFLCNGKDQSANKNTAVSLGICALPEDMYIHNSKKIVGTYIVDKDPIVLHFVKEGFLVVTKWGPEAEDPTLVNEKHN